MNHTVYTKYTFISVNLGHGDALAKAQLDTAAVVNPSWNVWHPDFTLTHDGQA